MSEQEKQRPGAPQGKLQQDLEILQAIQNATVDAVQVLDTNGVLVWQNDVAQRVFGHTPGESPQRAGEGKEASATRVHPRVVADGVPREYECTVLGKEGERKLWVRTSPIHDGGGRIVALLDVSRDVTERMQVSQRAHYAHKLESLSTMAGGIAHDFNNLLMGILGNADLLLHEVGHIPRVHNRLREIERAARRAADLTAQMLAFSGHGRFISEAVNLTALLREMAQLLAITLPAGVQVRYDFSEDLPAVIGDPAQLHQAFMDLFSNAAEALQDHEGAITVRTGTMHASRHELIASYVNDHLPAGQYVFFEIADTGCGMEADMLARAFDPFFTTKFMGRGMGLAAVLGIVRGHKGALLADTAPGWGARFRVLLPPVPTALYKTGANKPPDEGQRSPGGKVLLVLHDHEIGIVLRETLERAGLHVLMAEKDTDAGRLWKSFQEDIDCVLLDPQTAEEDLGEGFWKHLSAREVNAPVLVLREENTANAPAFPGDSIADYVSSPLQLHEVVKKVSKALAARHR